MIENGDIKQIFGYTIRRYRNQMGISQEKFAELTGLHRTYISEVECGERNVSLANINKIATALGVSLSELFSKMEALNNESKPDLCE